LPYVQPHIDPTPSQAAPMEIEPIDAEERAKAAGRRGTQDLGLLLLRVFVGQHKLGVVCIAPQDVILDPARALILQPDLMFISKHRQEIISDHIWGAPDLVVEVMSPQPRIGKLEERLGHFTQYGVKECWLVHQLSREIEVLRLQEHGEGRTRTFRGAEAIESGVLREFRISPEVLSCW
jgi:Uma2 family endonuclease